MLSTAHSSLTTIRIYAEMHWAVRRPVVEIRCNGVLLESHIIWVDRISDHKEAVIIECHGGLSPTNVLEIVMSDRSAGDIVQIDGTWTEHAVFIKEIEVDGIKFEMALYRNSEFTHSMPDSFVKDMANQGIKIESVYANCTDMRLNGTVTIKFSTPVWRWVTEDLSKIWI